jgi:ribosome-binding protein aMBF1 (putative translation factor)
MSVPKKKPTKKPTKKRAEAIPAIDASDLEAVIRDAILKKWSVNDIAKQFKVSQSMLSRFVRGDRTITLPLASRICGVLQLRLIRVAAI